MTQVQTRTYVIETLHAGNTRIETGRVRLLFPLPSTVERNMLALAAKRAVEFGTPVVIHWYIEGENLRVSYVEQDTNRYYQYTVLQETK